MTRDERDPERDDELSRLLQRWSAPLVPDGIDERMLAAYRRQTGAGEPWWSRLFTASVRVPLPVAVGVLMLLIVTAALALRPVAPQPTAGTTAPSDGVILAYGFRAHVAVDRAAGRNEDETGLAGKADQPVEQMHAGHHVNLVAETDKVEPSHQNADVGLDSRQHHLRPPRGFQLGGEGRRLAARERHLLDRRELAQRLSKLGERVAEAFRVLLGEHDRQREAASGRSQDFQISGHAVAELAVH